MKKQHQRNISSTIIVIVLVIVMANMLVCSYLDYRVPLVILMIIFDIIVMGIVTKPVEPL